MQTSRHALRLHACAVPLIRNRRTHQQVARVHLSSSPTDPLRLNEVAADVQEVNVEYPFLDGGDGIPAVKDSIRPGIIKREIERVHHRRRRKEENRRDFVKESSGNDESRVTWRHCWALLKKATANHNPAQHDLRITGPVLDLENIVRGLRDHPQLGVVRGPPELGREERSITLSGRRRDIQKAFNSILGVNLVQSDHDPNRYFIKASESLVEDDSGTHMSAEASLGEPDEEGIGRAVSTDVRHSLKWDLVPEYIVRATKSLPSNWTERNFLGHVRYLTNLRLPPSTGMGPRRLVSIEFIYKHLRDTMLDGESTGKVPITTESLNMFIRFLHTHSYWARAVEVYQTMDRLGCRPDANTYALLMTGSAKAGNVRAIYRWLRRMIGQGISPNLEAWAAVYQIIPDVEHKQRLALETLRYNLVRSPEDVETMIQKLALVNAGSFLDSGGSILAFYDALHLLFGRANLHSTTYRFMIDEVGLRGRLRDAATFLEYLHKNRYYQPTVADLNILLTHCAVQENVGTAVAIVYVAIKRWDISLDEESFARLFRCFNWSQRYHCLRVVWKVACLSELTTLQMRRRLLRSLKFTRDLQSGGQEFFELRPSQQWENNFGRFACDVLSSDPDDGNNGDSEKEIHDIMNDNLALGKTHRFTGDFAELLLKAYRKDAPLKHGKWKDALRDGANLRDLVGSVDIPMGSKHFNDQILETSSTVKDSPAPEPSTSPAFKASSFRKKKWNKFYRPAFLKGES